MRTLAQFTLLILMLFSCKKETTAPVTPPDSSNRINFDDPQVGQKSYYRMFEGVGYDTFSMPNINLTYLEDTLVVELIQDNSGSGFMLKEYFTAGSKTVPQNYYRDSTFLIPISITTDSVDLKAHQLTCCISKSRLMHRRAGILYLKPYANAQVDIDSWRVNGWTGGSNGNGYAQNETINENVYPHLNIMTWTMASIDGPTYHFIYEKSEGIVRTTISLPWTSKGYGFDLIK